MNALQRIYNQPYYLLLLTTLFWAGNAIAGKFAVGHISPFILTFLRWSVVLIILLVTARQQVRQDWREIKPHLFFLFILGTVGFALFNNLMYLALTATTAINVTILQSSMPLFIFILNFIFFQVSATRYQLLGLPITMLGVILITTQGRWQVLTGLEFNFGDLIMLMAIFAYAIYSVLITKKPKLHWISLISVLSCSAFISSLPFALWEVANHTAIWPNLTGWMIVIYTAIFASLMSQLFWIRSIELIGSNATGLFINLVPLLGTIMAILLLGETFHTYHFFGMTMIIGGVLMAQRAVATKSA
ncbi:DMT family transporter [Arenicella sp.]|nr:DMT family transporter [Arenicella sp.]